MPKNSQNRKMYDSQPFVGFPNLRLETTGSARESHHSIFFTNICNRYKYHLSGHCACGKFSQNNIPGCTIVLRDNHSLLGAVLQCPWFCFGSGSILAVFLRSSGAPAISWCLTLDFIGVLQWLQAVLRDIDCPAPPRQAPHNADEWTRGPAKSN